MATLHQNVCAINLAKALYYVRADYYGIAVRDWDALEPRQKHEYVEHAQDVLEAVRPAPNRTVDYFGLAATLAQREADKVIGRISASEPWGVDPRD